MKSIVKGDWLFSDHGAGRSKIGLGTPKWFRWLDLHKHFIFQGEDLPFSARREERSGCFYWYGYCRRKGKLHKVYLGKPADLTQDKLTIAEYKLKCLINERTSADRPLGQAPDRFGNLAAVAAVDSKGIKAANDSFTLMNRLTPPSLPANLIVRPHLLRQLSKPITLISAPLGFGKTTLMNQWQDQFPVPVAWVSLEAKDGNEPAFWAVITLALQRIDLAIGDTVSSLLSASSSMPVEHIISRLVRNLDNWFSEDGNSQLALIIDNYHLVHNSDIDAACQFFLDHLNKGFQVIIASEANFSFDVERWRSKGLITELTKNDLRFSLREGIEHLERISTASLTAREKMKLALEADGWIAGLNILAAALNDEVDLHRFIASFDGYHPYLKDFYVKEILKSQPASSQRFLLQTSILRNLCGSLCDAVVERRNSEQMLRQIYRESQLLNLLDATQGWYQYHELFDQSLQHQLRLKFPDQVHDLHWRAAHWYQQHEFYSEAIHHYVAAGAWSRVARLIDQVILDELKRGSDHDVLRWLQQLPEEVFLHHQTLLFTYARLGRASLPVGQVKEFLERIALRIEAISKSERSPNERTLRKALKRWQSSGELNQASFDKTSSPDDIGMLWQMLDLRDRAQRLIEVGNHVTGERLLLEVIEKAKAQGLAFVVVMTALEHVSLIARLGRLSEAEVLTYETVEWLRAQRGGSLPASTSVLLVTLSKIAYARNQLDEARRLIEETAVIDPHPTSVNILLFTHGILAHILNAQGDAEGALTSLQAALDLGPFASSFYGVDELKVHQAKIYLCMGDLAEAERNLRQVAGHMIQPFQPVSDAYVTAWASLFLAQGRYQKAESALKRFDQTFQDRLLFAFPFRKLILAQTYWAQRKISQAEQEIMQAIRAAEPEGITRPFLDCRAGIVPLLSFLMYGAKLNNGQRQFVKGLLDQLKEAHPNALPPTQNELSRLTEAALISPREQQVLQLVAEGLNNRALASHLSISDSTVRTHLRNIYRKLGVTSRTQAVRRARELQII